jgi:hypothetical protein
MSLYWTEWGERGYGVMFQNYDYEDFEKRFFSQKFKLYMDSHFGQKMFKVIIKTIFKKFFKIINKTIFKIFLKCLVH